MTCALVVPHTPTIGGNFRFQEFCALVPGLDLSENWPRGICGLFAKLGTGRIHRLHLNRGSFNAILCEKC